MKTTNALIFAFLVLLALFCVYIAYSKHDKPKVYFKIDSVTIDADNMYNISCSGKTNGTVFIVVGSENGSHCKGLLRPGADNIDCSFGIPIARIVLPEGVTELNEDTFRSFFSVEIGKTYELVPGDSLKLWEFQMETNNDQIDDWVGSVDVYNPSAQWKWERKPR